MRSRRYRARRESARARVGSAARRAARFTSQRPIRWWVGLAWLAALVIALVLQTSVIGRIRIAGVSPDLVMVVVAAAAFRLRDNGVLLLGFLGGLILDVSGTSVIGLWSFAMTLVAWAAVTSREHGGRGALVNASRISLLTLVGIVAHTVAAIAFGDWSLAIGEALVLTVLVPALNLGLAILLFPVLSRLWVPSVQ